MRLHLLNRMVNLVYWRTKQQSYISNIALKRNWIVQGGRPDTKRCAQNLLNDFRTGRLGKLTLDINE